MTNFTALFYINNAYEKSCSTGAALQHLALNLGPGVSGGNLRRRGGSFSKRSGSIALNMKPHSPARRPSMLVVPGHSGHGHQSSSAVGHSRSLSRSGLAAFAFHALPTGEPNEEVLMLIFQSLPKFSLNDDIVIHLVQVSCSYRHNVEPQGIGSDAAATQ